jgi:hypothetical protein
LLPLRPLAVAGWVLAVFPRAGLVINPRIVSKGPSRSSLHLQSVRRESEDSASRCQLCVCPASRGLRSSCVSSLPRFRPTQIAPRHPTFASLEPRGLLRCVQYGSPVRRLPAMSPSPSAVGCQSFRRVPSSWFCTTSTGSSTQGLRACCIPVPDGVRRVSVAGLALAALPRSEDRSSLCLRQVRRVLAARLSPLEEVRSRSRRPCGLRERSVPKNRPRSTSTMATTEVGAPVAGLDSDASLRPLPPRRWTFEPVST